MVLKFRSGNTPLWDKPRPTRSSNLDQNAFREFVVCNLRESTRELALDFNTSQSTICRHLKKEKGEWKFSKKTPFYCRNIVLLYDNTKSHSARITQENYWPLTVLSDPPNSRSGENLLQKTPWTRNQLNFTREESTSYLINITRWSKMIANILLIEMKSLLNNSWTNYFIYFTKMEIINDSIK